MACRVQVQITERSFALSQECGSYEFALKNPDQLGCYRNNKKGSIIDVAKEQSHKGEGLSSVMESAVLTLDSLEIFIVPRGMARSGVESILDVCVVSQLGKLGQWRFCHPWVCKCTVPERYVYVTFWNGLPICIQALWFLVRFLILFCSLLPLVSSVQFASTFKFVLYLNYDSSRQRISLFVGSSSNFMLCFFDWCRRVYKLPQTFYQSDAVPT